MGQARSQRCSTCDIDWPLADTYTICLKCGGETWRNDDPPLTLAQTQALRKQIEEHATNEAQRRDSFEERLEDFERYYTERAVRRFREELEAL